MNAGIIIGTWYVIYTLDEHGEKKLLCGSVDRNEAINLLPDKYKDSVVVFEKIPTPYNNIKNFWEGMVA